MSTPVATFSHRLMSEPPACLAGHLAPPRHGTPPPQRRWSWVTAAGTASIIFCVSGAFSILATPANPIVEENSLPGTPRAAWQPGGAVPTIRGFTSEISVNKGEAVTFYVQTPDAPDIPYDLVVYRLGYYQGNGAREVARFGGVSVDQPPCLVTATPSLDPATDATKFPYLIDCGNWTPAWTWTPLANLVSGLFMAKVQRRDTRVSCGIFFVVRDDTRGSDILLQTSDTTWQAYNQGPAYQGASIPPERAMDGHSVYDSINPRAYKVSYRRPYLWAVTNSAPPYEQVIEDSTYGPILSYGEEYPMIRFLEANGFDVSYTTGRDSDQRGELIRSHRLFMTSGHDEYWSLNQRRHIQAARDAGVHLAFFSGNSSFWKIRWEDDYHTMVVFKEQRGQKLDPLPGVTTGLFRDPGFGPPAYDGGLPENGLLGLLTSIGIQLDYPLRVPAADGKLRFWRNTSLAELAPGEVATFGDDLLGYEIDGDVDNGFRPPGLFHVSTTEVVDQEISTFELGRASVNHHLSLYRASSGALVFHAGTIRLQRALGGRSNQAPPAGDPRLQQAIINLFADMDVQPGSLQAGLLPALRSTDFSPPNARVTAPRNGSCVKVLDTVVVSGSAIDLEGRVAAVEVSTDVGATWHPASGRESWTYTFTPQSAGLYGLCARAVDDSGNIGPRSPIRCINATPVASQDFVVNGTFDSAFDAIADPAGNLQLGHGWFSRSKSGAALSLVRGGLTPGVTLQRVVARGSGDGIGQNLILAPGREYTLVARVFVESGRVTLRFGRPEELDDIQVSSTQSGRWETLTAVHVPPQAACAFVISSEGGPATFKVDDVALTTRRDDTLPLLSLSPHSDGRLHLELLGNPGFTCCVQTSTNLLDWDFLLLGNSASGRFEAPATERPLDPFRFYRAELP